MHQLLTRIAFYIYRTRRRIETVLADTFSLESHLQADPGTAGHAISPQAVIRLKQEMIRVLGDCPEEVRSGMSRQISGECSPSGLWFMRAQLYQCVSHCHGQTEAQRRINGLLVHFQGIVPRRMLLPI